MAFKQIGELAFDVLRKSARTAKRRARELGKMDEAETSSKWCPVREGSRDFGGTDIRPDQEKPAQHLLSLDRSIITARRSAALSKRFPASAVVIDLSMERERRHAALANSP